MDTSPALTVVVPAHNAEGFLEQAIMLLQEELDSQPYSYEILIMENGSSDKTREVGETLANQHDEVNCFSDPENPGKGNAIMNGVFRAAGDIVCFCDVDLEIAPEYLSILVAYIQKGYDIAIASKRHPDSEVKSSLERNILSRGYNLLVRGLFHTHISSHQDGMKAFRRKSIIEILPHVRDRSWFWDTEVLVLAHWKGYSIKEVPICCDYGRESTFNAIGGVSYFLQRLISLMLRSRSLRKKIRLDN